MFRLTEPSSGQIQNIVQNIDQRVTILAATINNPIGKGLIVLVIHI